MHVGSDGYGDVVRAGEALLGPLLGEVIGVPRACVHREVTLGQPGDGTEQIRRHPADQLGAKQHGLHVPARVVVGEDRPWQALARAGRVQVASGREDRIGRVEGVLDPRPGGIHAPLLPFDGQELHPAQGAGAGHRQVAPVVGLDLVYRGQDLPRHLVLRAGRLVDGQQEGRDAELVDEEVRHTDGGGTGHRQGQRRIGGRRDPVGCAEGGGRRAGHPGLGPMSRAGGRGRPERLGGGALPALTLDPGR